jgi:hypothetical protein
MIENVSLAIPMKTSFLFATSQLDPISKQWLTQGLPDCIFSNQKSPFGDFLEGLRLNMLVYFIAFGLGINTTTIWYIL